MKILLSFFLGILAAGLALLAESFISFFFTFTPLSFSPVFLLPAAFIEELAKYLMIWKRAQRFDKRLEIIGQSLLIGLGFAAAEIFFHFYNLKTKTDIFGWPYTGLLAIHLLTAALAGYWISRQENKLKFRLSPLIINTLLHFSYNLSIIIIFR